MSENETLRRMMAEGYSRWRPDDDDDAKLERHYRNTWLCSACGYRNPLSMNTCPCGDKARS
jgi:hypothetical protein